MSMQITIKYDGTNGTSTQRVCALAELTLDCEFFFNSGDGKRTGWCLWVNDGLEDGYECTIYYTDKLRYRTVKLMKRSGIVIKDHRQMIKEVHTVGNPAQFAEKK